MHCAAAPPHFAQEGRHDGAHDTPGGVLVALPDQHDKHSGRHDPLGLRGRGSRACPSEHRQSASRTVHCWTRQSIAAAAHRLIYGRQRCGVPGLRLHRRCCCCCCSKAELHVAASSEGGTAADEVLAAQQLLVLVAAGLLRRLNYCRHGRLAAAAGRPAAARTAHAARRRAREAPRRCCLLAVTAQARHSCAHLAPVSPLEKLRLSMLRNCGAGAARAAEGGMEAAGGCQVAAVC